MATRFYMSSDEFSTVSFSDIGSWDDVVHDGTVKNFMYTTNPGDMSFIVESYPNEGQGTHKFRTFVSEGLSAGISMNSASFTAVYRISSNSSLADIYALMTVAIINSSGVMQVYQTSKDATEVTNVIDTMSSRNNTVATSWTYTTSLNDRLVFEIGWDQDGTGSTYDVKVSRGNVDGTDLSSTDGDTAIENPWFETDKTITFGGSEPEPPATNEDYNCGVYISAVLDEWV